MTIDQDGTWRCFQCDRVFTSRKDAERHFGNFPGDKPLCIHEHAGDEPYWRDRYNALENRLEEVNQAAYKRWKDVCAERDATIAERDRLREALEGLLGHSGLDVDANDKDVEDHALERAARAALDATAEAAPTEQASPDYPLVDVSIAAHARGIAEGRALQAEEDARIAESDAWRYWWDGQHVKHCVAKAIREAAKIGDSNGPTA